MDSQRFRAQGRRFAVATPHEAATRAGLHAFEAGGNPVDAALAASAVLAVAYPHMCGIGGDLFAIVGDAESKTVINGSGAAASGLNADVMRATHGSMPTHGPLSVSVPGTIAAWDELARRFGRLSFSAAIAPAVACADDQLTVPSSLARAIVKHRARLEADPGTRALFLPDGDPLGDGDRLRQPALASTLRRLADDGPAPFYEGSLGSRFIAGLRRLGSPLTVDDLRRHTTEVTRPVTRRYRRFEVMVPPPNSQGFVLPEILGCVERSGIEADPLGADAATIARLFLLASLDRDRFLADPRRASVPVEELLSPAHEDTLISQARAGSVGGTVARPVAGDTVGIVAVEEGGLWVSINQSLYDAFGSGLLEPETGILCHNRGSYFSLEAAAPNRLEGGKRPAHTLMPVMVCEQGIPVIVSATMGGSAHAQIHSQLLMGVIDQHRDAFEAVDRPRWLVGGVQRDGGSGVVAESRVPDQVVGALRAAGIGVGSLGGRDEAVGHSQVIARLPDGSLSAAADPRADGSAEAR